MNQYFSDWNLSKIPDSVKEIKEQANLNNIPIMQEDGMAFLVQMIRIKRPKRILEIGTAIGYSAIQMALHSNANIDTIERDAEMVDRARKNVQTTGMAERVRIFHGDALTLELDLLYENYDIIFIDAAKSQYINFFTRYQTLLDRSGFIVSDNLLFHGMTFGSKQVGRNTRHLLMKIKKYMEWLKNHPDFDTLFFDIGDGIAVSERIIE